MSLTVKASAGITSTCTLSWLSELLERGLVGADVVVLLGVMSAGIGPCKRPMDASLKQMHARLKAWQAGSLSDLHVNYPGQLNVLMNMQ